VIHPEHNYGFDDDGNAVPTVGPEVYRDAPESGPLGCDDEARIRQQTLARLIDFLLVSAPTATAIGRRVALLGYVLRAHSAPRSQRQLARLLGISPARVNAILRGFRREIAHFNAEE